MVSMTNLTSGWKRQIHDNRPEKAVSAGGRRVSCAGANCAEPYGEALHATKETYMAIDDPNINPTSSSSGTVTKTFVTNGAVKFELIGPGTALINRGAAATLSLTMPQSEQEHIEVKLDGDSLKVSHRGGLIRHRGPEGPLVYELTIPLLSELKLSGGLAAEAANIESRDTSVELKDGSSLTLAQVRATEIEAKVSSGGRLTASGAVVKLKVKLGDGSTYQGGGLNSEEVEIEAAGGAEATTRATKSLKVRASGGSTVAYSGEKIDLDVQTTGASDFHRLTV
jgi:hypothetical protein